MTGSFFSGMFCPNAAIPVDNSRPFTADALYRNHDCRMFLPGRLGVLLSLHFSTGLPSCYDG